MPKSINIKANNPMTMERSLGLPPGYELLPVWDRPSPMEAPLTAPFDREASLSNYLKRSHPTRWKKERYDALIPLRMDKAQAWFWLNVLMDYNVNESGWSEGPLPNPDRLAEVRTKVIEHCPSSHHLPQILLAFFSEDEVIEIIYAARRERWGYQALPACIGLAMFLTPYLPEITIKSLQSKYRKLLSTPVNPAADGDEPVLTILAALGDFETIAGVFAAADRTTRLHFTAKFFWATALPNEETYRSEVERLAFVPETPDQVRIWIACGKFNMLPKLSELWLQQSRGRDDVMSVIFAVSAPEISPIAYSRLSETGSTKMATSWLKRNLVHAVVGLAPLLDGSTKMNQDVKKWFVQQWENNEPQLQRALEFIPPEQIVAVRNLKRSCKLHDRGDEIDLPTSLPANLRDCFNAFAELKKKLPAWITLALLTKPTLRNGRLGNLEIKSLLFAFQLLPRVESSQLINEVMVNASAESLDSFAMDLFKMWADHAAPLVDKWVLSLVGNFCSLRSLHSVSAEVVTYTSHPRCVATIDALEVAGRNGAALIYSISIVSRTPGLKAYAEAAIARLATREGLSIPDYLDSCYHQMREHIPSARGALETCLFDSMVYRFQDEMVNETRRATSQFLDLITSPAARPAMQQLLWGAFDANDKLIHLFRVDEDGNSVGDDESKIELGSSNYIGVMHPMRLTAEEINQWQQVFIDHHIIQPFEQLQRRCCVPLAEDLKTTRILRFAGIETTGDMIYRTLAAAQWSHDKPQESGHFTRFHKEYQEAGIFACLRHDRLQSRRYADQDWEEDPSKQDPNRVQEIYFVKNTVAKNAWKTPGNKLRIAEIDIVILSEVLWLAHKACGLM